MEAVWLIRGRQLASRLRFWTSIVGYDPRERSISQRIYLVYLLLFFSLWGFSVLALFANVGAVLLSLFEGIPPIQAAIRLTCFILLADVLIKGYRFSRRSPIKFSDEDAGLICQTPVDRRQVAITWMLGDWLPDLLPYLALVVVLCFANIQLSANGILLWSQLPKYWLAGFRVASVITPLYLALIATVYAWGAVRLKDDRDITTMWIIPIAIAIVLISVALINADILTLILLPVIYPLESGFGKASWLAGLFVAIILATVGLLLLYSASPRLNLSRAAQESRFRWEYRQLRWLGDSRLSRQMKLRERLGTGHKASRLPGRAGIGALLWKDWLASWRAVNYGHVGGWAGVFAASLGMMAAPTWDLKIWAFIFWAYLVSQRCTEGLRAELDMWLISHQLPFTGKKFLLAEVLPPVIAAICLCWLAFGLCRWLGFITPAPTPWLIPGMILCITFTGAVDILRKCKCVDLLAGNAAEIGAGGLLMLILLAGFPVVFGFLFTPRIITSLIWLVWVLVIGVNLGIAYGMLALVQHEYNNIK